MRQASTAQPSPPLEGYHTIEYSVRHTHRMNIGG
jgi:hypothetical protein